MNDGRPETWTAQRFFAALAPLSPLRVVSPSGPSTFEAICSFGAHGFAGGFMNAIQPSYHWHLRVADLRFLRSHDEQHARSGRRVLFFSLHDHEGEPPFLWIYAHRERDAEFEPARERAFAALHRELCKGVSLVEGAQ